MRNIYDMIAPLTLAGVLVLALAGIVCLIFYRGRYRRKLVRTAAVFLTALGLYYGGMIVLGCFGMTWRNLPALIFCVVLLLSGWAGIVLTLACVLDVKAPGLPVLLRRAAKGLTALFAGVVFCVSLWLGPLLLTFAYGDLDRVVEYEDQVLVERMEGFLSPDFGYYAYHGPLVRGTERIWIGPTPIWGDAG